MNPKTKKRLQAVGKCALFLVLLMTMVSLLNAVFVGKEYNKALALIEKQPDGEYDVVLAGPSHMQFAVQPAQLFGEYGIAACNVSTTAQSVPSTYYMVREMIDRHDPELVVVDLFSLFCPDMAFASVRIHQALDHFPVSENKIAAIEDMAEENREEFYIPFLLYHGRWKELSRDDYMMYFETNETYQLLPGVQQFMEPFVPVPVEETEEIPEIPLSYLEKIVELCAETDTKLLLTVIPYRADVDNNETSAIYQQRLFNKAQELAGQWGVDFLNGLHVLEEMEFDFTMDMVEYSHVNASGAKKISAYYGEYIREHYAVPDRSQDPAYEDWYADYEEYLQKLQEWDASVLQWKQLMEQE